jgi:hypothetical protein
MNPTLQRAACNGGHRCIAWPVVGVVVFAFLSYVLLDLYYLPHALIFGDESRFLAEAHRLIAEGSFWTDNSAPGLWTENARAWEMPGAAIFYAIFVDLFSTETSTVLAIRVTQAALLIMQALLIGFTAARIFGKRRIAFAAFAMTAFYPFLIFYQGLLLAETLFDTLLIAGFASLYAWRARGCGDDRLLLLTCLCLVAATMTKATLTVLTPVLVVLATAGGGTLRVALRSFIIACAAFVLLMAPWWVRNALVLHGFVPFTTSASQNLYIGNNPRNPMAGIDWRTDVDPITVRQLMAIPDEIDRQRAFAAAAIAYIKEDPRGFTERMGRKFLRFWNVVPNAREYRGLAYQVISAASFGPVLVLAMLAAILYRRRTGALLPIYALFAYFTLVHVITIASLRYRLPLEPFLILMAAAVVGPLVERLEAIMRTAKTTAAS